MRGVKFFFNILQSFSNSPLNSEDFLGHTHRLKKNCRPVGAFLANNDQDLCGSRKAGGVGLRG